MHRRLLSVKHLVSDQNDQNAPHDPECRQSDSEKAKNNPAQKNEKDDQNECGQKGLLGHFFPHVRWIVGCQSEKNWRIGYRIHYCKESHENRQAVINHLVHDVLPYGSEDR